MAGDVRAEGLEAPELDGAGMRVAVVASRFNGAVTRRLLEGVERRLRELDLAEEDVTITWVPGAFEIPAAAQYHAMGGAVDAVVCIGCVIRGETSHYEYVAGNCAAGIMRVGLDTGVPVVFGVLTTDTLEQAQARSTVPADGPAVAEHNVGAEGAAVAVEMVMLRRRFPVR